MNTLQLTNYNIDLTLLGGQSFTWVKNGDYYLGTHKDNLIVLKKEKDSILWQTFPESNNLVLLKNYLNINTQYSKSIQAIKKDKFIKQAISKNPGIRILKQDFETVLLNFILSSHKSVKGVRKLVRDISINYGQLIKSPFGELHAFPDAKTLSKLTEKQLRDVGAGFRAPYIKAAAEKLVQDKYKVEQMDTKAAKQYLLTFRGIGEKISDCILVFGLAKYDITPLDIWGKRVLTNFYKLDSKLPYSEMSEWYSEYFGKNTAIAGQFLFEYIRNLPTLSSSNK